MKWTKLCLMLASLFLALSLGNNPWAQVRISKSVIGNASGGTMINSSSRMIGTVGQTFIGQSASSVNISQAGVWFKPVAIISDVEETTLSIPIKFQLEQNYPNPFNPATTIRFSIPKQSQVTLKIYDVLGREVATIVNKEFESGVHEVVLDSRSLTSGVYIYQIQAGEFTEMRKLMLLK